MCYDKEFKVCSKPDEWADKQVRLATDLSLQTRKVCRGVKVNV
jgi:hypothetical protein